MKAIKRVNGRLSPEDVEYCVQAAIAENRLEGLESTEEEIQMLRKCLSGEITEDEYMAWVRRLAG